MDYIEATGLAAAFFVTVANIPQAVKLIKTKSAKSLAASTYAMLLAGGILWVLYGIFKNDFPIILANSISGSLCGFILFVKLIELYKTKKKKKA